MIDIIKVIILGIVEGLTEFLPVSSTGHLIVFASLLNFGGTIRNTFEIFIQIGAVVAVILYYRSDLIQQVKTVPKDTRVQHLWLAILIAFIPAAVIGFLFNDLIDSYLLNPTVVAITLIIGGIIFIVVERQGIAERAVVHNLTEISYRQALFIGVAQTFALIPGVSRSGASIIGAMLTGLDRKTAAQFSFYLAIPTLGLASLFKLVTSLKEIQPGDWVNLLLGAVVSGVVAWLVIDWFLRRIARNSFQAFGYYRIAAGIIILILAQLALLH